MEILAEAGADVGEFVESADLFRLEFAFAVDNTDIDLETVLVDQKLFDPVVELEEGADQDQAVFGVFDQFFEEVVGCTGVEKLGHSYVPINAALYCGVPVSGTGVCRRCLRWRHGRV